LVIIIVGALLILAYCTDSNQSSNFQDVIYSMCGKKWQTINSLCIILYMFGCCITFFIIIGDQLDQSKHSKFKLVWLIWNVYMYDWSLVITCIFGAEQLQHWYFHRKFTIAVTSILFILPLCYPKRIDFLTYPRYA
jgi:sodium-coupled neutral amino acid transporter 7/8